MALSQRFELRQTQSLVMTPQLMQAIKLLQLSNLDVLNYVEAELERNPMLERIDDSAGGGEGAPSEGVESHPAADYVPDEPAGDGEGADSTAEAAVPDAGTDLGSADGGAQIDADMSNEFQDDTAKPADEMPPPAPVESWASPGSRQPVGESPSNLEAFVAETKTLAGHLEEQLGLAADDPAERMIGQVLIAEIDEAGYFRGDVDEVAQRLGASSGLVEKVLHLIQTFDPSGIGARDLAECLAIQLRERDRFDPAMQALVNNLDLVARRDLARLLSLCGVDRDDLIDMIAELRALDPKPGSGFAAGPVQIVVPDVTVRAGPDGDWLVELNQDTLPRVLVNHTYFAAVSAGKRSEADRSYLNECMQSANWLTKSLDQRARTILRVTSEIVRQQDAFFLHGVEHLRPLNLRTVADAIDMHESTVSRVTSNKYVATARGIFELKYFFSAAIPSAGFGEAHSAEAVRHRIRRMIDDEASGAVLSDDAIVKKLSDSGIEIARRTVAKYREAMRIPSSVQRRREKMAAI